MPFATALACETMTCARGENCFRIRMKEDLNNIFHSRRLVPMVIRFLLLLWLLTLVLATVFCNVSRQRGGGAKYPQAVKVNAAIENGEINRHAVKKCLVRIRKQKGVSATSWHRSRDTYQIQYGRKYGHRTTKYRNTSLEVVTNDVLCKSNIFDHTRFTGHIVNTAWRWPISGNQYGDL